MLDDNSPVWRRHALLMPQAAEELDRVTIALGTPGFTLMQRAGAALQRVVETRYAPMPVLVICGPGRNGGDGFVLAELLRRKNWPVQVAMATPPDALQGDAALARVFFQGEVLSWAAGLLEGKRLVVDALFGIGLSRDLEAPFIDIVETLNASTIPVLAVDIPSGVDAATGALLGGGVNAAVTVTFTRKKPGLLLLPGRDCAGTVVVVDIALDRDAMNNVALPLAENHPDLWQADLPRFLLGQHKYDHGHALLLGGSVMTGAARLAARAAQRVGTGLVTIAAEEAAASIYATNLDSVLVQRISHDVHWQQAVKDPKKTAMLLGPGAGVGEATLTKSILALTTKKPCVLDADALTSFSDMPDELFGYLYPETVLTPHMGEFNTLFGRNDRVDKCTRALNAARISGGTILLKGADTVITTPRGLGVINANAPPWLATAGSGDVLAGIIAGLMAQRVSAFAAACIGTWLHGAAAAEFNPGMIAEDLIDALPKTLAALRNAADQRDETLAASAPVETLKSACA
ncbi:MAG: NAD(P)H-hydrate dehydratase [Alphaproteobacteria bacterium]